jgi:hypothetical protein
MDILITRPLGLATTITGSALFVVLSPFIGLSAIAPPHDAFERVADVFIVVPATYTFLRPVGKFLCPGDCRPSDIKGDKTTNKADPVIVVARPKGRVIKISMGTNQGL